MPGVLIFFHLHFCIICISLGHQTRNSASARTFPLGMVDYQGKQVRLAIIGGLDHEDRLGTHPESPVLRRRDDTLKQLHLPCRAERLR